MPQAKNISEFLLIGSIKFRCCRDLKKNVTARKLSLVVIKHFNYWADTFLQIVQFQILSSISVLSDGMVFPIK